MRGLAEDREARRRDPGEAFDGSKAFDLAENVLRAPPVCHPEADSNGEAILRTLGGQTDPDRLATRDRYEENALRRSSDRKRSVASSAPTVTGHRLGIALE